MNSIRKTMNRIAGRYMIEYSRSSSRKSSNSETAKNMYYSPVVTA
jgi:hypothetical protein